MKRARLRPVSREKPSHREVLEPDRRREFLAALCAAYGWRCARCHAARPLDPHHVVKRSASGPDGWDNEVPLCRACHAQTDDVYSRGRLVFEPIGGRRFHWAYIVKADKWQPDPSGVVWTEVGPSA